MKKGGVTVYISLVFLVLLTFVGGVLQSAWLQTKKNHRRGDVKRGLECCFGEYHKELWEEYGILAVDGSYEEGEFSESKILNRIQWYAGGEFSKQIREIHLLTDREGEEFFRQGVANVKGKYFLDEIFREKDKWEEEKEKRRKIEEDGTQSYESLEETLKTEEKELPEDGNPIGHMKHLQAEGFLSLVVPKNQEVSSKEVALSEGLEFRNRRQGNWSKKRKDETKSIGRELLFQEYLLDTFSFFTSQKEDRSLSYEVEYLLFGKGQDVENIEEVAKAIQKIRFLPNYLYLQSDEEKKMEARAMAGALSTALALPAITEVLTQLILVSWAYGEGIVDVRTLLKGGKVPFVKTKESWQLQLSNLLKLGTEQDLNEGGTFENGQDYKDYLRVLLYLRKGEPYEIRGLGQIERNLKQKFPSFRGDGCFTDLEIQARVALPRNMEYRFRSQYGYE